MLIQALDPSTSLGQEQSSLFSTIPPEIRDLIFHFVLLSDEVEDEKYDANTCYVRPGYTSPRRVDAALLRTCKRVYQEAWFRPWSSNDLTLFFTSGDRQPDYVTSEDEIAAKIAMLVRAGVQPKFHHLKIFAQMYNVEPGRMLQSVLDMADFQPKDITICIRHTDWWYWEEDQPLRIGARWVNVCRLPYSVTHFRMELETLTRKKHQVDSIASQMRQLWFFKRQDGALLEARAEPTLKKWTGTSVWHQKRWKRDEVRAMELEYYVATVVWEPVRPEHVEQRHAAHAPDLAAINPGIRIYGTVCQWPPRPPQSGGEGTEANVCLHGDEEDDLEEYHEDENVDEADLEEYHEDENADEEDDLELYDEELWDEEELDGDPNRP